ncbi:MAG: hypothetical protein MJZ12_03195 [Prevotella sp.]|nr:hypothetical protein [Prevotella sp.]
MSLYKWRRLLLTASRLGVSGYIANGIQVLIDDPMLPKEIAFEAKDENYDISKARMYNIFTQKKFLKIQDNERHSIDTSIETVELLRLIVANADEIITSDISLPGIISIGKYLRTKGDKVDFVKMTEWLHKIGIKQIASLLASILIELFDFEEDEIEFLKRRYVNPLVHYDNLLISAINGTGHKFRSASRINVALVETTSYHLGQFISKIRDIEE